jgi:hypothetical protein
MNRDEAVVCLKEITNSCIDLSPNAVTLVNSEPDDPLSTGYRVHIKAVMDNYIRQQIRNIVENRSLKLKEENDELVIYQPKIVTETV